MPYKSVQITEDHVEFLEKHPEVNFSAISRQALERRMGIQELLDEISYDGILQEVDGEASFQAQTDMVTVKEDGEVPVEISVSILGGESDE